MKKRITVYLIAIVTLINLSSLGTIVYLKWTNAKDVTLVDSHTKRFESIQKELNLTPRQIEQFAKIRTEYHARLRTVDTKFSSLRKEMLKEIWEIQEPDSQKMENILDQFSKLQLEAQRWTVQHFYGFKEILTPEQSGKFYNIISERVPDQHSNPGLRRMIDKQEESE